MGILFAGAEPTDFPVGGLPLRTAQYSPMYRSSHVRTAVGVESATMAIGPQSRPFDGGGVTTAWLSTRICRYYWGGPESRLMAGLCDSSELYGSGIWIILGNTAGEKVAIAKYDGTTVTPLEESDDPVWTDQQQLHKIDMQVQSYGASANVRVFVDGGSTAVIDYSGDIRVGSMTAMDCVTVAGRWAGANDTQILSEIIAATSDTRSFSLAVLELNAAGDANQWTGAYADLMDLIPNDIKTPYVNSTGRAAQFGLSNLPAGDFYVWGIKIIARACSPPGSTANKLKLGVKSGGSIDLDAGHSLTENYDNIERWATTINVANLTPALVNAMQIAFESAS